MRELVLITLAAALIVWASTALGKAIALPPLPTPCPHPPGKGWVWLPEIRAWSQETPHRWRIVSCDGKKVYVPR